MKGGIFLLVTQKLKEIKIWSFFLMYAMYYSVSYYYCRAFKNENLTALTHFFVPSLVDYVVNVLNFGKDCGLE